MNINVTSLIPEANSDLNTRTRRKINTNVKTALTIQLTIGPSKNFLSHIGTRCVSSYLAQSSYLIWNRNIDGVPFVIKTSRLHPK